MKRASLVFTPAWAAIRIGSAAPRNPTTTLDQMPMPNQMTISGMRVIRGTALSVSTNGPSMNDSRRYQPVARPSGTPISIDPVRGETPSINAIGCCRCRHCRIFYAEPASTSAENALRSRCDESSVPHRCCASLGIMVATRVAFAGLHRGSRGTTLSAMNERFDLQGRVVIVTGGGKGIGKVYAREFARAGARVVAADIDGEEAEAVAGHITAQGGESLALRTDIADRVSAEAMAAATLDRFGAIDALINNASLMSVLPRRSWLEIPVEEWDAVMAGNLRGMFLSF